MAIDKNEGVSELSAFYDTLKNQTDMPKPIANKFTSTSLTNPFALKFKTKANQYANQLKDDCSKHILLDIYCKILPLDKDYVDSNKSMLSDDIDSMLTSKGMGPTQYLKSCYESTKAPLLEFVNRSIDDIANAYLEAEQDHLEDTVKNDLPGQEPEKPDAESEEIDSQIVDIKDDPEYDNFIDKLKEKTIDKIVSDVSNIINDKKEEKKISFDPKPIANEQMQNESVVSLGINYIQSKLMKEGKEINPDMYDEMMGLAIREATLNQFNEVFNQSIPLREYATRIRFNKGILVNESAVAKFLESAVDCESSPTIKEVDGKKYDVSNFSSIDKDGVRKPINDDEAKKVLGPQEYDSYKKSKGSNI